MKLPAEVVFTLTSKGLPDSSLQSYSIQNLFDNSLKTNNVATCRVCSSSKQVTLSRTVNVEPQVLVLFWSEWGTRGGSFVKTIKPFKLSDSPLLVNNMKYDLVSVVLHCGLSNEFGHSKALIKVKDCWLCCNDESVFESSLELTESTTPFLLFYQVRL